MKKIIATLAVFSLSIGGAGVAGAASEADSATVIHEGGCQILSRDSGLPYTIYTYEGTHSVVTPNGVTTLTCHFTFPKSVAPVSAAVYEGFRCATYTGLTLDSRSVVTPGGQITLICQIKPAAG